MDGITEQKLIAVKPNIRLFAMDYDGTLADGQNYGRDEAIKLIESILEKGKTPAFITARAATAIKTFVPPLGKFYQSHPDAPATFIGGGNGTILYQVDARGVTEIYNHGLSLDEIKYIVAVWKTYAQNNLPPEELNEMGLAAFKNFYGDSWDGLIPTEILDVGRAFNGRIFTEASKVTFVFPQDASRNQGIVNDMQKLVGEKYRVLAGGNDFCHITKRLEEDGKVVAVKTVLVLLGLNENQVATFGDMPGGNDRGLLSFPYSFTNYGETIDPVGRVHKAIRFLLE
jgi:hydroxymethylpyrimidine pyrophosphatase-like HAD family hydrolase